MNSPMMPGQKSTGKKAPRVVRVDVMTGQATSSTALRAAAMRGWPSCMCR